MGTVNSLLQGAAALAHRVGPLLLSQGTEFGRKVERSVSSRMG